MSMSYEKISFGDDDGKYFIHFSSKEGCDKFKNEFNGSIGHTCCTGKGVHVKTYNGVAVDNAEIYENIRKEYNTS
jgi:hypothetical protein